MSNINTHNELDFYKYALDQSALVTITDISGKIIYVNDKFCETSLYSKEELIGNNLRIINSGYHPKTFFENLWNTILAGKVWRSEVKDKRKDGTFCWFDSTIIPFLDVKGAPYQFMAIRYDITDRVNAVKIKEQFLANISHEIRTPLFAIVNFIEFLKDTNLNPEQINYLDLMGNSSDLLLKLINDLLDISKIEEGKLKLEKVHFNLKDLISKVLSQFENRYDDKIIKLELKYDNKIPEALIGDSFRIQQILINLINNSYKYTEKGKISVKTEFLKFEDEAVFIEFVVRDTGVGISRENQKLLFEKYTQANDSDTRLHGGTGLGLSLVKDLVELHGGTIELSSLENKGTAIKFLLPLGLGDKSKIEIASRSMDLNKKIEGIKLKILVADDSKMNQMVITKHLQKFGFDFDVANNGVEAIDKLKNNVFDLVIMDVQMPVMDGLQATNKIRNDNEILYKDIPIIAATAGVNSEIKESIKLSGANDFISKPYNVNDLYDKIINLTNVDLKNKLAVAIENKDVSKRFQYINLDYLQELSGGDQNFINEMITHFIDNTPAVLEQLRISIDNKDLENVFLISHKFIPQLTFVGIKDIIDDFGQIEQLAKNKTEIEKIDNLITKVSKITLKAIDELKNNLI